MDSNLYELVLGKRARSPGRRRIALVSEGTSWSFEDLDAAVGRLAGGLRASGVRAADRVVVQVGKSAMALALYLAVLRLGATYIPLNTDYTASEVSRLIADTEPVLYVGAAGGIQALRDLAGVGPPVPAISLEPNGTGELVRLSFAADPVGEIVPVRPDSVAAILFTSGTTGRSKGAMLTHRNLEFVALALREAWEINEDDSVLHALPLFHAHGLFVAANTALCAGARLILQPKFTTQAVIERLPFSTVFMGVPTFYSRLLADPEFTRHVCRNVRLFTSGSAPLTVELFNEFGQRTGHTILERYGMTETTIITSNPLRGPRVPGTVGYALPGVELRVRPTEEGGDASLGELEVRGPNVFSGYWRMPEQTALEMQPDGFLKTGDIARIGPDGRVALVGRSKDLIITGGYNVYPREVEEVLGKAPGVREVAVVGVPHPDFGEGVIAIAELERGAEPPAVRQVLGDASLVLAKYKLPKKLFFVDSLPRNAMGKVLKGDLRKQYCATFAN